MHNKNHKAESNQKGELTNQHKRMAMGAPVNGKTNTAPPAIKKGNK
jgi:hypothetical protein